MQVVQGNARLKSNEAMQVSTYNNVSFLPNQDYKVVLMCVDPPAEQIVYYIRVFATDLIFCYISKSNGKIQLPFVEGALVMLTSGHGLEKLNIAAPLY